MSIVNFVPPIGLIIALHKNMPCDYNSPAAVKAVGDRKSFLDVDVCCLSYIGLDRAATRPLC